VTAVLRISERDNVAVALEAIEPGQAVAVSGAAVVAREAIPPGHKIALLDIATGQPVLKYGSPIGLASKAIAAGDHVHIHNVESTRGRGDRTPHSAPRTPD
jgi:altronate dehydratase